MKSYKYPGELGRATDNEIFLEAAIKFRKNPEAEKRAIDDISTQRYAYLCAQLFKHYGIPLDSTDDWIALVLRLAKQHVPAFTFGDTRRLGRPAKLKNMLLVRYPKHPTRGRKPDAERRKYLRELLRRVLADMLRQNIKGRGSIKTVLINRCTEELKAAKLSGTTRLPAMVRKDQKDVSEAKKLFPEIAAKFPK